LEEWPPWVATPIYITLDISVAGPLATMATHGHLFIRKWPIATH